MERAIIGALKLAISAIKVKYHSMINYGKKYKNNNNIRSN